MTKEKNQKQLAFHSELLLKYNFKHAFFTKSSFGKDPEKLLIKDNKNIKTHQLRQVHSNRIVRTSDIYPPYWPEADGIISESKNKSLWIYSADCIPILIADKKEGRVGAFHVGLKAIKNLFIGEIIQQFHISGSNPSNLVIAMGPAISGQKYQVEIEEGELIIASLRVNLNNSTSNTKENEEEKLYKIFIKEDIDPKKIFLDIRLAAKMQLMKEGIKQSQIDIKKLCTFSNPKLFHSWRRDQKKEHQWSFISS